MAVVFLVFAYVSTFQTVSEDVKEAEGGVDEMPEMPEMPEPQLGGAAAVAST